jgi:hypothetical protein
MQAIEDEAIKDVKDEAIEDETIFAAIIYYLI